MKKGKRGGGSEFFGKGRVLWGFTEKKRGGGLNFTERDGASKIF